MIKTTLDGEIWKIVPFAPDYEVSNYGRVYANKFNFKNYITPRYKEKTGYYEVALSTEPMKRKWILLHRLVLSVFNPIENMENLEVNHIDEDKSNNRLDNLQWVTSKENCNYGKRNQNISDNGVRIPVICEETGMYYRSLVDAASDVGLKSVGGIRKAIKESWRTSGGYHWRLATEQEIRKEET